MAKITIKGPAITRTGTSQRTGKPYTIITQPAVLETSELRGPCDLELQDEGDAKAIGSVWNWNPEADLRFGRYGIETGRYWTLTAAK